MSSHITIRPADMSAGDLETIAELAGVIWRRHYPGIISNEQIDYMLAQMYDVATLRADVDAGVRYDLLCDNGRPIGFLGYGTSGASNELKIHKLYVMPEYHGRGLGSLLLKHALEYAASHGYAIVILNVNKHNAKPIAFYRRNGFTLLEEVVVDIGGGFVMDDYIMVRPPNQE